MKMKALIYIGIIFSVLTGCARGPATVDKPGSPNLVSQQGSEDEYELTIIDPGFRTWFATYARPISYHSPAYYAQQNANYVKQWNILVDQQGRYRNVNYPFENRIDYDPRVDYGVELNHELYWYFRYVEQLHGSRYNFGFSRRNI